MKSVLFVIILFLIFSCEPYKDGIRAGIINKNVIYTEISPPKQVMILGKDSIDIDADSQYDLVFYKSPKPLLSGFSTKTEILKKSNIQIIMDSDNQYPVCLDYEDAINSSSKWSETDQEYYILQSYICGSNYCPVIGNFANVSDKYLAFKLGNNYGWIKLDNSISGNLTIKGFALSN